MTTSPRRRPRVRVEELLFLFGEPTTARLIDHCGGKRVPSPTDYRRARRRREAVHDWLRGYSMAAVALKHQLSLSHVKRLITRYRRQRARTRTHAG